MTIAPALIGRRISAGLIGIAMSMLLCDPALASDQDTVADAACVVVGLRMIESGSQQQQSAAGMVLAAYYLGRLDRRLSEAEGERLIESEAGKMSVTEFRANAVRCGKALTAKGQEIQKIGSKLSEKGQGGAGQK